MAEAPRSEDSNFYSRPCGRGDKRKFCCILHACLHFYSRPCGRGDSHMKNRNHLKNAISTHAPAGGATIGFLLLLLHPPISTHAPAGGATWENVDCPVD